MKDINRLYQQAPERAEQGNRIESLDEMTGVQALERRNPGLPMCKGKVLKRGNFTSVDELKRKVLAFIEYHNLTNALRPFRVAKPFKWTYQGKALAA